MNWFVIISKTSKDIIILKIDDQLSWNKEISLNSVNCAIILQTYTTISNIGSHILVPSTCGTKPTTSTQGRNASSSYMLRVTKAERFNVTPTPNTHPPANYSSFTTEYMGTTLTADTVQVEMQQSSQE